MSRSRSPSYTMRRHGWQRPLHPLQFVGMAIYSFLVVCFYTFLGLFLGNQTAEITLSAIFSFVATSVMFLFVRCTAIDPTDRTSFKKKKKAKKNAILKLNYGFLMAQIVVRFFRRVEKKMLRTFIKRKYLDPLKMSTQVEPLLPFPLVMKDDDDAISPNLNEDDISFCALCNFEVKKHSKHCRTCNRCVEGFDHHCRWLNNCVGKKNYTTFFLLMIFVLLMLIIEGGTAIAIFVRCFVDKRGIEKELQRKLFVEFPRGLLVTICVLLLLLTAYSSAALGQLFFFHVVLIRKGMRTYDYILAMREENEAMELESLDDSDLSSDDDSIDFDSPEKPTLMSKFLCKGQRENQNSPRLSIRIEGETEPSSPLIKTKRFHVSINPWKLIKLTREKAILATEKARERLMKERPKGEHSSLRPLPLETKRGPLMNVDTNIGHEGSVSTPFNAKEKLPGSPLRLSSPRRRFSAGSPSVFSSSMMPSPQHKYRSSFDLKLTGVSRELETHISRQVLSSVISKDGRESEPSPR